MQTIRILSGFLLSLLLVFQPAFAGNPFVRKQAVVLGAGHCVTPVQSFASPVYSYQAPVAVQQVVTPSYDQAQVQSYGDDVSTALKIITEFKLKQQTLDRGLESLGYNQAAPQYVQPQATAAAPYVNYGLAPYEQGTTQYQVESYSLNAFGSDLGDIQEQLNSLMRLSENMQKGSVSVSASVGNTVSSIVDGVKAQSQAHVDVARIQAEAAARIAMLSAAKDVLEGSRVNSSVSVNIDRKQEQSSESSPDVTLGDAVSVQAVKDVKQFVLDKCASCHAGGKTKGNFSLDGPLDTNAVRSAIASVLSGEMPKDSETKLTVDEMLDLVQGLHTFGAK